MPRIHPIVKAPHLVLRKKAAPIPLDRIASDEIQRLIADMQETLRNTADGVGLAAPQIGRSLRLFVISEEAEEIDRYERAQQKNPTQTPQDPASIQEKPYPVRPWKYRVFINPQIKKTSRRQREDLEGCLSVPHQFGSVKRQEKIMVAAYDEQGKKFTRGAAPFFSRVIQHELDHLEGVLFIDKAVNVVKIEPRPAKKSPSGASAK